MYTRLQVRAYRAVLACESGLVAMGLEEVRLEVDGSTSWKARMRCARRFRRCLGWMGEGGGLGSEKLGLGSMTAMIRSIAWKMG